MGFRVFPHIKNLGIPGSRPGSHYLRPAVHRVGTKAMTPCIYPAFACIYTSIEGVEHGSTYPSPCSNDFSGLEFQIWSFLHSSPANNLESRRLGVAFSCTGYRSNGDMVASWSIKVYLLKISDKISEVGMERLSTECKSNIKTY